MAEQQSSLVFDAPKRGGRVGVQETTMPSGQILVAQHLKPMRRERLLQILCPLWRDT